MPPDGWNSLDGTYAFRYVDADGKRPPLLVKALSVREVWVQGQGSLEQGQGDCSLSWYG